MNVYLSVSTGTSFSPRGLGDLSGPLHCEEIKIEYSNQWQKMQACEDRPITNTLGHNTSMDFY